MKYDIERMLFKVRNPFNSDARKKKTKLLLFFKEGELYGFSLNKVDAIRYCKDQFPKLKGILTEREVSSDFIGYIVMNKVHLKLRNPNI